MKKMMVKNVVLCTILFLYGMLVPLQAASLKFYYQRPVEVVQSTETDRSPDSSLWACSGNNFGKYSIRMERVEVTSLEQLKQLLGIDQLDESQWPKGAAGLVGAYLSQSNKYTQANMEKVAQDTPVFLTDTTATSKALQESAAACNVNIKTELSGLYAQGGKFLHFGSGYFDQGGYPDAKSCEACGKYALIHETAHLTDNAILEEKGYGEDGTHQYSEITRGTAPMLEAFAEYCESKAAIDDGNTSLFEYDYPKVTKVSRDSTDYNISDVSGDDLLHVEGILNQILMKIAKEIPDGDTKIRDAFYGTNTEGRTFTDFIRFFATNNPGDVAKLKEIVKSETFNKFSDADLDKLLSGSFACGSGGKEWVQTGTTVLNGISWKTDGQGNRWYQREDGIYICIDKNGVVWQTRDGVTWIEGDGTIWHTNDGKKSWNTTTNGVSWVDQAGQGAILSAAELAKVLDSSKGLVNAGVSVGGALKKWLTDTESTPATASGNGVSASPGVSSGEGSAAANPSTSPSPTTTPATGQSGQGAATTVSPTDSE